MRAKHVQNRPSLSCGAYHSILSSAWRLVAIGLLLILTAGCEIEAPSNPVSSAPELQSVDLPSGRWISHRNDTEIHAESFTSAEPYESFASAREIGIEAQPSLRNRSSMKVPPILEVRTRGALIAGLPIGIFADKTLLMLRDGAIHELETPAIVSQQITNEPFRPIDARELSTQLQSEFGTNYRVRYAAPYLVVAKPDRLQQWSERFRSFQHSLELYCATHNITLRRPDYPLVAIVFGSHREFLHYARTDRSELPPNCLGYYSQSTNRIVLFERDAKQAMDDTLETICHEATHQIAFNTGLHQRMSGTPLWLAEGFAVLFEAPSLSNLVARDHTSQWPASQIEGWRRLSSDPNRIRLLLDRLIRSDEPFKSDTLESYTVAWAASNYLSTRRGREYAAYLQRIGGLAPFEEYSAGDRMRDFVGTFGGDLGLLTKSICKHLETLQ